MDIRVAMTVDGKQIEAGTVLNIIDDCGVKVRGTFLRAYPDNRIPHRMNIVIKRADKEKVIINGTDAKLIEVA